VRVPDHIVQKRRERLAALLQESQYLPLAEICRRLGVSEATARRDLAVLESKQSIQRTFGGAVSFYNSRFPSFEQRLRTHQTSKRQLALQARSFLQPGMVCFFDAGTSVYLLAEELRRRPVTPLTVVTGNLPVAELLAKIEGIQVHLLGGQLVARQSVLLGPAALSACTLWTYQLSILSAEGMDHRGLWNSQEEIIALQKTVLERSQQALVILDHSKLGRSTDFLLADWSTPLKLLADLSPTELATHSIPPEKNIYVSR
jgi:DeoR/GlpR family transcriptional regulator of sugar metabolism